LEQVDLIPPSIKHLQLDRFLKNGESQNFLTEISMVFCFIHIIQIDTSTNGFLID